jgi:hypothetical protein
MLIETYRYLAFIKPDHIRNYILLRPYPVEASTSPPDFSFLFHLIHKIRNTVLPHTRVQAAKLNLILS